jgi:hypothetical protein
VEAKLLELPQANYTLEIGQNYSQNLGKFQANSLIVFAIYEIISTPDENSKEILKVEGSFS